ncbi:MAG: DNA-binding protein [Bacilli bacterium]
MNKTVILSVLYDFYKELLTKTQQKYFEDYYFSNLTLREMADIYQVSRAAISKQLQQVTKKLEEYEAKLQLKDKRDKILLVCQDNKELVTKIEDIL